MEIDGYLLPALTALATRGDRAGMVVIDEPDGFGQPSLLARQTSVLGVARTNRWPVWFITLNDVPLHATLRGAAPGAVTYTKPRGNAFEVDAFRLECATRECAAW